MEVSGESMFALEYDQPDFRNAGIIAGEIIRDVLENGMPEGAELLNVNFPKKVQPWTPIKLTEVGRRKYTDKVMVRRDPGAGRTTGCSESGSLRSPRGRTSRRSS